MSSLEVERGLTSPARSHLSGGIILTLAFGCGLLVANLYFGQPLAAPISASTGLPPSLAGVPVTLTQVGYAIALLLLAPLGDICETRAVVVPIVLIGLLALVAAALSSSPGPFLVASLGIGICPVGGQILLPYAARLAPEHERGHVVGKIMSGLILGIMLSRPMGSFVASVAGWRAIYWLIAAGEAVLAVLLLKVLPSLRPQTSLSYTALLRSLLPIWRNHAELRYRAVIHGGLLAAFILFWTAAPLHLTRDFGLGQQAIGLFALAGVSGACVAPFVGRIADAGHRQPRIARAAQLVALTTAVIPFVISFFGHRIWAVGLLACAGIVLDAAVTANMILSQRAIFSLGDEIRTRVNALYMASIFLAGACGSALGGWGIATGGWPLAAAFGVALTGGSLLFALLSGVPRSNPRNC